MLVQKNYVDDVTMKDLIEGAINGMLTSLDAHSAYLTPDLYRELQVDTRGTFGGLGIEITLRNGLLTVVSPIEDTPASAPVSRQETRSSRSRTSSRRT